MRALQKFDQKAQEFRANFLEPEETSKVKRHNEMYNLVFKI